MQHQGLGVHKVIKRFSNYYWSHVKGSMQISGRAEAVGVFSLLSRKQSIFSGGWRPNTDTEKKGEKQVSIENSYLTLKWENFENSLWHNRQCLPMIFFFFFVLPLFYFWLSWEVFIVSPEHWGWCLPNFRLQNLTASRRNMVSWLPWHIFIYKSLKSILLMDLGVAANWCNIGKNKLQLAQME